MWSYTEALAALRQVLANAGGNPSEVGLHSLRVGAATTLAAGGKYCREPFREKEMEVLRVLQGIHPQ